MRGEQEQQGEGEGGGEKAYFNLTSFGWIVE